MLKTSFKKYCLDFYDYIYSFRDSILFTIEKKIFMSFYVFAV
jgi:hypothetical protein